MCLAAPMREPPDYLSADAVLAAVGTHWAIDVDAIEHLPVGFGAHHWRVLYAGTPRLFVTLDDLGPRHSAESLEAAYAGAGELAGGLEFVVAPMPTREGGYTVPLADGRLSCTPWLDGHVAGEGAIGSEHLAKHNVESLARLHATPPPPDIPSWRPRVEADFGDSLTELLREPWRTGPYAERAQTAVTQRIDAIRRWTASYHELGRRALDHPWVPTHGEPHTANQFITSDGVVFVDWESLALAPRERDLRSLVAAGYADLVKPDWDMIELFDLEWRLDEIAQYALWFSRPHTGTENDRISFDGLIDELAGPD